MTHDPLCPRTSHHKFCEGCTPQCGTCQCDLIAKVRTDERRWVTASAGRESLNHKVKDGVCACGMDAPDALEHLAWIVSDYVRHSLKPEHEVKPLT